MNPAEFARAPTIKITGHGLKYIDTAFMIDTGAAVSVIKEQSIHERTLRNQNEIIILSGITNEKIKTLGTIKMHLYNFPTTLHIVPDNFPISQEGILGADFLKHATYINFENRRIKWRDYEIPFAEEEEIIIPARSQATVYVNVQNKEIQQGYLPRLRASDGIFLGDALVKNQGGKAYIQVTNTLEEDRAIRVPTVTLEEIEQDSQTSHGSSPPRSRDAYPEMKSSKSSKINLDNAESMAIQGISTSSYGHFQISNTNSVSMDVKIESTTNSVYHDERKSNKLAVQAKANLNVFNESIPSRLETLKLNLRLEHLNHEEKEYVERLVNKYSDVFHLPDEHLSFTNKITHRIITTDNTPINTKQYRFPSTHREEINKQMKNLIKIKW